MTEQELKVPEKTPYDALVDLLQNNRIFDTFYTHVSLVEPKGKFSFSSRTTIEDFWFYYQRTIRDSCAVGIAEVPLDFIPVLVDIDLKFKHDVEPKYSEQFVKLIIQAYQDVLREVVDFPARSDVDNLLTCAWLNKEPYYVDKEPPYWKNGFHLHFFNLFINKFDLEAKIIPRVLQKLTETPMDDWFPKICDPEFLDRKAIGNTWLLYGSTKAETLKPYKLHKIYNGSLVEINPTTTLCATKIYDANEELISLDEHNYSLYLPRIFSILPACRRVYDIKRIDCIRPILPPKKTKPANHRTKDQVKEDVSIARELVGLFSPRRAVSHNDWMTVGWALYNITNESDEGLDIWIKFSQQTEDHDEARCIYEWSRMQNRQTITLGTLKMFARQDNETAYLNYMSKLRANKQIKLTERGLADLFAEHCQGEFVYCKKTWYEFKGHFWEIADEAINLKKRILEVLIPLLKKIRQHLQNETLEESEDSDKTDRIGETLKKLERVGFLNDLVEACKLSFHDQKFENNLDRNRYLIGFENGVYDLLQDVFRRGAPTDLITNHMPISYREFKETDDEVREVKQFFERVLPNPNVRRYFMDIMSELFVGYNHRKNVFFLTGDGDNGKSMTQMFFEKMLGSLSIKAPTTLLTSKKPAVGSATEELARAGNGVRLMWLEEPDPDEEICEGFMKQLSGNDTFYTRALYKSGKEIEPMFKMLIVCNNLPKFRFGGDKATWNRARVIKFESTFCSNAPLTPEEQLLAKKFPRDTTLDQRIPKLVEALAWLLLEHRKLPRIDEPTEVITSTREYREENDIYAQFISICFVRKEGAYASSFMAQEYFKEFVKDYLNRANMKIPSQREFVKAIVKQIGSIDETCHAWPNYITRSFKCMNADLPVEEEGVGVSAKTLD